MLIYRFLKFNFIFNWRVITILYWFLLYISMNQPQAYTHPGPLEPPSHFPRLPTPLRGHKAPDLGSLCHTANSHRLSPLHMVTYVSQCCSLNSSRPLLPPLCPQVCSLGLHLLCCPANRNIRTVFLDSVRCLVFSFSYFTLYSKL